MKLFQISLTWQMALATVLGILFGLFFGDWCSIFAPWASAYIMMLKVTTTPYLAFAIMHGIGQLKSAQAITILKKGLLFIGLVWAINLAMIYLTVFLFPQSTGSTFTSYVSNKPAGINFAEVLIPENIFYSLSNNLVPSVVIFSLLMGISLMHIRDKHTFMEILDSVVSALTKITAWISRITPIGTFLIIANQVGTIQLDAIKQVTTYIVLYITCLGILIFWVFPRIVSSLTGISPGKWLRDLFPILILAYTTNVAIICIPFIIEFITRELQRIIRTEDRIIGEVQGIVSVVFNLPLASLFITIFIFFVSIFYSIPLSASGQLELFVSTFLTSLGSVGLGAWINSLTFILDTLGLPVEAINIYLSTLPFTSGFQSMLSVMEITTLSFFITLACHKLLTPPPIVRFIRKSLVTAGPILLLVLLLKSFNPLPRIQNTTKSIYDVMITGTLLQEEYPTKSPPTPPLPNEDVLDKVLRTKTLRVGCNPFAAPFAFCNHFGELAGFDLAYARELASNLNCRLELVPLNYNRIKEELDEGLYDIGMSGLSMTEERLSDIYFSPPYLESPIIFVAKEKFGKKVSKKNAIFKHTEWRIAVLKNGSFECRARKWFPNNPIVLLNDYDEFAQKPDIADVLFWSEQEAISWALKFPEFTIIHPSPALGTDALAFAIKFGSNKFFIYLREWLQLKEVNGFKQEQYDLWILGNTRIIEEEQPRWSILHDVIHWKKKSR